MKYILKDIFKMIKSEKMIFLLIILCSFISSVIIYFAYGLGYNFSMQKTIGEASSYEIQLMYKGLAAAKSEQNEAYIDIESNYKYFSFGELKKLISKIDPSLFLNCNTISTNLAYDSENTTVSFDESGGMAFSNLYLVNLYFLYDKSSGYFSMTKNMERINNPYSAFYSVIDGKGLVNEDFLDGNKKAVVSVGVFNDLYIDKKNKTDFGYNADYDNEFSKIDNPIININGMQYDIIGLSQENSISIPVSSLNDDTVINTFMPDLLVFSYDVPVTHEQYTQLKNLVEAQYPELLTVKEIDFEKKDTDYFNLMLIISALIAVISLVNTAIMFRYVLMKRRKQIAVFRLCGCPNMSLLKNFISEVMLMIIPSGIIGALIYFLFLKQYLIKYFIYLNGAYSLKDIIMIYAGYILLSIIILLVMIFNSLKRMPVTLSKEE